MKLSQLPLFLQGKLKKATKQQAIEPVAPTAGNSVMQTLPAYMAFLGGSGYSESTTEKYFADIRKFSFFLREKKVGEITQHDIQQWIAGLLSQAGYRPMRNIKFMDCVHPILFDSKLQQMSTRAFIKKLMIRAVPRPLRPLAQKIKRAVT